MAGDGDNGPLMMITISMSWWYGGMDSAGVILKDTLNLDLKYLT